MKKHTTHQAAELSQEQEDALLRFDEAWENGETPDWQQVLPAETSRTFLNELVHIDLERKLRAGLPARVETYLASRPELSHSEEDLIELITAEYRLRSEREAVTLEEYHVRFPHLRTLLASRLGIPGADVALPAGDPALTSTLMQEAPRENSAETLPPAGPIQEQRPYLFLDPPQAADEIGRLGSYRVLKALGAGGMGLVFLAEDMILRRRVALKVLKPGSAVHANSRQRFLREAQAMAAVEHDHIVGVHQVGEANGIPFVAMQYLQGTTLESCCRPDQLLSLPEVIRIGREISEGLAAAHARGLIHRDIKPANIWLEERPNGSRRVRILDFGLARLAIDEMRLTQSGDLMGTPFYMAPEQARDTKTVDHRCDLFSLGCVLYELCTGQRPFAGASVSTVLRALMKHTPTPPCEVNPKVSLALSELVMRLLAKDPMNRAQSAREVADTLTEISRQPMPEPEGPSEAKTAETPASAAKARAGRRRVLAVAALAATVVIAAVVIRLSSETGQLIIEADDPEVEVVVKQNGAVIVDRTTSRRIELRPGEYGIELVEGKDGLRLSTTRFTLRRGDKEVVKVEWRPMVVQKEKDPKTEDKKSPEKKTTPKAELAVSEADAKVAEWVLSVGGKLRVRTAVGERDVVAVKELPTKGLRILSINLHGNPKITDDNFPSLERLDELRELYLNSTKVGDRTMRRIAAAVKLRNLDLGFTAVTDEGLIHIESLLDLQSLGLAATKITDAGMVHLEKLSKLEVLNLPPKVTDKGMKQIAGLTKLKKLGLNGMAIGDEAFGYLRGLKDLEYLAASATRVTDIGMGNLAGLTNLNFISLNHTAIGDVGVSHLAGLTKLQALVLNGTRITSAGLSHFRKLVGLQTLWVPSTSVDDEGLGHLTDLPMLAKLTCNGTAIGDAGLKQLEKCPSLLELFVGGTKVTADGVLALQRAKPRLWIDWDSPDRAAAEWALKRGGTLRIFPGHQEATVTDPTQLPKKLHLLEINQLRESDWKHENLAMLRGLAKLRKLDLFDCPVADTALANLVDLPSLTSLELGYTGIGDASIPHLVKMQQLTDLGLAGNKFTEAGLKKLRAALPKLKDRERAAAEWVLKVGGTAVIQASGQPVVTVKPGETLPAAPFQLRTAYLMNCPVVDADLSRFKGLEALHGLDLRHAKGITDQGSCGSSSMALEQAAMALLRSPFSRRMLVR